MWLAGGASVNVSDCGLVVLMVVGGIDGCGGRCSLGAVVDKVRGVQVFDGSQVGGF